MFGIEATAGLPSKEGAGIESFKLHINGKRQTLDSSLQFLKIENEQIKTAQNDSYGYKIA